MTREDFDYIMQNVCDICHKPYMCVSTEELEDLFCGVCPVENNLRKFLEGKENVS